MAENYGKIIENIPVAWLQFYTRGKFPKPLEFKPFFPKWWKDITSQCGECENIFKLKDTEIFDPFVNEVLFCGTEYYVFHNCPKCKKRGFSRQLTIKIFEEQMMVHINNQMEKTNNG